jgi:hypothetical protein
MRSEIHKTKTPRKDLLLREGQADTTSWRHHHSRIRNNQDLLSDFSVDGRVACESSAEDRVASAVDDVRVGWRTDLGELLTADHLRGIW